MKKKEHTKRAHFTQEKNKNKKIQTIQNNTKMTSWVLNPHSIPPEAEDAFYCRAEGSWCCPRCTFPSLLVYRPCWEQYSCAAFVPMVIMRSHDGTSDRWVIVRTGVGISLTSNYRVFSSYKSLNEKSHKSPAPFITLRFDTITMMGAFPCRALSHSMTMAWWGYRNTGPLTTS